MPRKRKLFGLLAPRYRYYLNPYPELRFLKCLFCEHKTGQRKVPLIIHVDPRHLIALGYTHRYCRNCDVMIGHKHEIEGFLYELFARRNPEALGNRYVIMGTMEVGPWRASLRQPLSLSEMLTHTHDLKTFEELRMTMGGWFPDGQEPPVMTPPVSELWVKRPPEGNSEAQKAAR